MLRNTIYPLCYAALLPIMLRSCIYYVLKIHAVLCTIFSNNHYFDNRDDYQVVILGVVSVKAFVFA